MNNSNFSKKSIWALIISLLITLSIGMVAGVITKPEVPNWYIHLNMPPFSPPNWLFAPVWTILYVLIAISAWIIWRHREQQKKFGAARNIYIIQLVLNFLWSIIFFGMHQIFLALITIGLLELSIVITMIRFSRINTKAAWLLFPYLLWVSFATLLNASVFVLNH